MELRLITEDGDGVVVACHGNITMERVLRGPDPFERVLGPGGYAKQVFLDLEHTEFIDSAGIGWFVMCHKRFVQRGGRLVLHSLPPLVEQVFQLVRLHTVLPVAPNLSAARALVSTAGAK